MSAAAAHAAPAPGLADAVHDAQRAFRAALQALARPGQPQTAGQTIAGLPLGAALAHLLLALTDEDTPVWWQRPDAQLARWLRFHTGARSVSEPGAALFAVITDPVDLPPLGDFAAGSPEAPETAATLLIEVPALRGGLAVQGQGPGIADAVQLQLAGLPGDFWARWQANHALFPQGVDLLFTCGEQLLGLPRSTRVRRLEEVA